MKNLILRSLTRLIIRFSASRRKKSLVFLVSATLLICLTALSGAFYLRDIKSEYQILSQQRTNRLVQLLTQIQSLEVAKKTKGSRAPAADESEQ